MAYGNSLFTETIMQKFSLMAPQHPRNDMKKMMAPIAINKFGVEKYFVSKNVE